MKVNRIEWDMEFSEDDDIQPVVPQVDDSYWEGGDSNCDYFVDLLAENVVDYVIKKKETGDE